MAIFSDIELVSVDRADPPGAFTVAFDVIYAGETWCRSVVEVDSGVAARLGWEQPLLVRAARDALLDLLALEARPVSFHLRLSLEGQTVLARATPGGSRRTT